MRLTRSFLLAATLATTAGAQMPNGPRTPGDTLKSPVIGADGSVKFQLYAPKATAVSVRSEGPAPFANQAMQKSEQGVWTLTSPPVDATTSTAFSSGQRRRVTSSSCSAGCAIRHRWIGTT